MSAPSRGNPFLDAIDDPLLRAAYLYWTGKRAGRRMPCRRDIDPTEIPTLLPHIMIVEMQEEGTRYRFRLAGSAITAAFGRPITGGYVHDLAQGRYRSFIEGLYRDIYLNRRCILSESPYDNVRGSAATAKRLMMPLSDDDCTVNQVLAIQTFEHKPTEHNRFVVDDGN
jgi:hypothetical protein